MHDRYQWLTKGSKLLAGSIFFAGVLTLGLPTTCDGWGGDGAGFSVQRPLDSGALWANRAGHFEPVMKASRNRGYIFRVESVAADAARTIVNFTIEGPYLEHSSPPPSLTSTFNWLPSQKHGYGSMRWGLQNGRIVGQVALAPLPTQLARVSLSLKQIGGEHGDWSVSFFASRRKLDGITRSMTVIPAVRGEGYNLTISRILLAPTETTIEVRGLVQANVDLQGLDVAVDGKKLTPHSGGWPSATGTGTNLRPINFFLPFDPVTPDAKTMTLRLRDPVKWLEGGPVIDLRSLGNRVQYKGLSFDVGDIVSNGDATRVALNIPGNNALAHRAWAEFADWVLVDSSGSEFKAVSGRQASHKSPMYLWFPRVDAPVRLEARRHAERLVGSSEIVLPVQPIEVH